MGWFPSHTAEPCPEGRCSRRAPGDGQVGVCPASTEISNKNTWLLFLPLFPVKTKIPVVLGIGVLVLLLDVISLLLLGHLLIFHLYLSMCLSPYSSQAPMHSLVSQVRRPLSWPLPETSTRQITRPEETPLEGQQGSFCSETSETQEGF